MKQRAEKALFFCFLEKDRKMALRSVSKSLGGKYYMDQSLVIVGLGPGDPGMLPLDVWKYLNSGYPVYLRTAIHPTVQWLEKQSIKFTSMDHHYQKSETFDEVYAGIAKEILEATQKGPIVYAVPGHPMVAEESVALLLEKSAQLGVETKVVPAMSFLDAMSATLKLDPCKGLYIVDALSMDQQKPEPKVATIVTQVYDRITAGETKLTLMEFYPDEHLVTVIRAAGVPGEERLQQIPLFELDRIDWIDHLTSLYIGPVEKELALDKGAGSDAIYDCSFPLDPLVEVMGTLRAENGCPWDREQNHETLKPYLIEEAYEVIDALDEGQMYKICEELGDLLLQIVFHAQIAKENNHFDINDVVDSITEKMIRRHPHVFGSTSVKNSSEVLLNWDKIKAQEKGNRQDVSQLSGIPRILPALMRAEKVQAKAAKVGFDWPDYRGALDKVEEELREVIQAIKAGDKRATKEELGDLLFAVVNMARLLDVEAEEALSQTTGKFIERFNYIEEQALLSGDQLVDLSLEQMDKWWEEAKQQKRIEITKDF